MATKELLGTNRGFELNDVTQFTAGGTGFISFSAGTTNVKYSGTYGGLIRSTGTSNAWGGAAKTMTHVITTDPVYCAGGLAVTASFWHRIYQDTLPTDGRWGTRTMDARLYQYNAADEAVTDSVISTTFPNGTYAQVTHNNTTSASTVYLRISITYTMPYYMVEPGEASVFNHYVSVDDFSITVPGSVPRAMMIA